MRNTSKRYRDDFKKIIIEVYNSGKPIKDICEVYGITYSSVSNWVNKNHNKEKISKEKKESLNEEKDKV